MTTSTRCHFLASPEGKGVGVGDGAGLSVDLGKSEISELVGSGVISSVLNDIQPAT